MSVPPPTKHLESQLLQQFGPVVGIDEVGRGAIAGPVAVGAVLIDETCKDAPDGLADSKLLSERKRENLVYPIRRWCVASAVGWASPAEISQAGLTAALRLAGWRALESIIEESAAEPACALLDGKHDWLTPTSSTLFDMEGPMLPEVAAAPIRVVTQIKADLISQVVAAASIIAKVERDRYMSALEDPGYHWVSNKGYASSVHIDALRTLGPCEHHRLGWKLPGVST